MCEVKERMSDCVIIASVSRRRTAIAVAVSIHIVSPQVLMQVCVRPPCARRRRASAGARALGIWVRTSCSDELSTLRRKRGGYTGARAMASARGILNNQSLKVVRSHSLGEFWKSALHKSMSAKAPGAGEGAERMDNDGAKQ